MPAPDDDPGVGPEVALTYRATVDVPARFRKSKSVGAVFGLTCSKYQSGEVTPNRRLKKKRQRHSKLRLRLIRGATRSQRSQALDPMYRLRPRQLCPSETLPRGTRRK